MSGAPIYMIDRWTIDHASPGEEQAIVRTGATTDDDQSPSKVKEALPYPARPQLSSVQVILVHPSKCE